MFAWRPPWLEARQQHWLERRIPKAGNVRLGQRNLFIFLSPLGLAYLFLTLLLWIGATNFQNSPAHGLCFLMLAILWLAILYTFANVSGLQMRFVDANPVFAGDTAWLQFEAHSASAHQKLEFFWPGETAVMVSMAKNVPQYFHLPASTNQRGYFSPGRLCLQSAYPLGIVRCWTWLDLGAKVLVYPKPIEADFLSCSSGNSDDGSLAVAGSDDFFSLKPYNDGDALSRVAWKHYAAGRGLFVREYVDYKGSELWLDFYAVDDADTERRLSKLCYCALQLCEAGRPFGLRLPSAVIAPGVGETHLHHCLRALALGTV